MSFLLPAVLSLMSLGPCWAEGPWHYQVALPLQPEPVPWHLRRLRRYFRRYVAVLRPRCFRCRGVGVLASGDVVPAKVERVANVLAQYLDNDGDGRIDDQSVAHAMDLHGAVMIMFENEKELERAKLDFLHRDWQDVEGSETGLPFQLTDGSGQAVFGRAIRATAAGTLAERSRRCRRKPSLICDSPLEEVFHLVTDTGFAHAYPEVFATKVGSNLTAAMTEAIGDCGFPTPRKVPKKLWKPYAFPNCSGWYHYDDRTCDFGCLATEYLHHVAASYNGEYAWGRTGSGICNVSSSLRRAREWEPCVLGDLQGSRKLLKSTDTAAWRLVRGTYRIPLRMPDGRYAPKSQDQQEVVV